MNLPETLAGFLTVEFFVPFALGAIQAYGLEYFPIFEALSKDAKRGVVILISIVLSVGIFIINSRVSPELVAEHNALYQIIVQAVSIAMTSQFTHQKINRKSGELLAARLLSSE